MDIANPEFEVPRELKPSPLRRFLRRTLYLRILDGSFVMWCFETERESRRNTDLLAHPRVVLSDPQAFSALLQEAMREVGVSRLFRQQTILILHCLRDFDGDLTPLETQACFETSRRVGSTEFFFLPLKQWKETTDRTIVTMCQEVGALRRRLTKKPTR